VPVRQMHLVGVAFAPAPLAFHADEPAGKALAGAANASAGEGIVAVGWPEPRRFVHRSPRPRIICRSGSTSTRSARAAGSLSPCKPASRGLPCTMHAGAAAASVSAYGTCGRRMLRCFGLTIAGHRGEHGRRRGVRGASPAISPPQRHEQPLPAAWPAPRSI
jgi:hypothetical protein